MKTRWLAAGLLICLAVPATLLGQTVEMAGSCDALQKTVGRTG